MLRNDLQLVIIGDIMLDEWVNHKYIKKSPETGVPVVEFASRVVSPGGAANSARIATAIWGKTPILLGSIGGDEIGLELQKLIAQLDLNVHYFPQDPLKTTLKRRVRIDGQEVCRIDSDVNCPINADTETAILAYLKNIPELGIILLSDYNKGFLTPKLIQQIIQFARQSNIPIIVDPAMTRIRLFAGANIIKPNKAAFDDFCLESDSGEATAICDYLVVTNGEKGVDLITNQMVEHFDAATVSGEIDVTGAGDAFAVGLSYTFSQGFSIKEAVSFAIQLSAQQVTSIRNELLQVKNLGISTKRSN
jgi:D-beta-D-heptose 7-phosphate kinase/D-beta-D-heptose 1-phosphate adenosyltransferase